MTPWFGEELTGGAERLAFQTAKGLSHRGHDVTVLTTCSRSFNSDWSKNFYPAGLSQLGMLAVMRFACDQRDGPLFESVNRTLLQLPASQLRRGISPIDERGTNIFLKHNINSLALQKHLASHGSGYAAVIFLPYLYGPILNGWRIVADRAYVQPCLHDEAYAYLPEVAEMMRGAAGLLFNSRGEFELALRLFGPSVAAHSQVVGSAIEVLHAHVTNGARSPRQARFLLYLGRRADTKNIGFLVEAFRRYRMEHASNLQLILAGSGNSNYSDAAAGIEDLGYVTEARKRELLAACDALVQPSKNESYSRTVMEAWSFGKPVVVHAECAATSFPVLETSAGWVVETGAEWGAVFASIEASSSQELSQRAAGGLAYVQENASWPRVVERIEGLLARPETESRRIDQFVERFEYADAISLEALAIEQLFSDMGVQGNIYGRYIDQRMAHLCKPISELKTAENVPAIVHAADLAGLQRFDDLPQRKLALIHGNLSNDARLKPALEKYAGVFTISARSQDPAAIAPTVDLHRWAIAPDETLMSALQDGRVNILSVGTIAAGYGHEELLGMFAHYLTIDLNARLVLVGKFDFEDPYYQRLLRIIHGGALAGHVLLTGIVSEPALAAIYSTATVFCTLSEREQLGLSIVEAMWFNLPVCAFNTPGVSEVMGDSGVLINDKDDLLRIAALLRVLSVDQEVRDTVLESQRRRREFFGTEASRGRMELLLSALHLEAGPSRA